MIKLVEVHVLELPGADQQLPHSAKQSSGHSSREDDGQVETQAWQCGTGTLDLNISLLLSATVEQT